MTRMDRFADLLNLWLADDSLYKRRETLGFPYSTLANWRHGRFLPHRNDAERLAGAMRVDCESLVQVIGAERRLRHRKISAKEFAKETRLARMLLLSQISRQAAQRLNALDDGPDRPGGGQPPRLSA